MELTKGKFCEILCGMEQNYLTACAINKIIDNPSRHLIVGNTPLLNRDFFNGNCLLGPYEQVIIDLLEVIMDDKNGYITYYCCDLEFGYEHFNPDYDVIIDGERYYLDTPEDLWEILQLTK